jgi:hypothetical protein
VLKSAFKERKMANGQIARKTRLLDLAHTLRKVLEVFSCKIDARQRSGPQRPAYDV